MISGIPYSVPRLPLSLTSDTNVSLSQKPSVNAPTPLDPVSASVNLMMPLSDLRWTEGMFLFRTSQLSSAICPARLCPRPRCSCTVADHASPEDGCIHGGKKVSTHMPVRPQTHTRASGHGNSAMNWPGPACQIWMTLGGLGWKKTSQSLRIKYHWWSIKGRSFHPYMQACTAMQAVCVGMTTSVIYNLSLLFPLWISILIHMHEEYLALG